MTAANPNASNAVQTGEANSANASQGQAQGAYAGSNSAQGSGQGVVSDKLGVTKVRSSEAEAAKAAYIQTVMKKLARNKKYPTLSRRKGEEGIAKISVTINANGKVEQASIAESSGFERLDDATLRMAKTSFKAFPELMADEQITLVVPVDYSLQ